MLVCRRWRCGKQDDAAITVMMGPIITAADGSEGGRQAIAEAGLLAQTTGRSVIVVYVRREKHAGSSTVFGVDTYSYVADALNAGRMLAEAQAIAELDSRGLSWTFVVREGQPAAELMKTAEEYEADTIVVAGKRQGILGSVAHAAISADLLHRWPHSLFVVRPRVR
jgi:nucleotide-binding universal stress UspA family protein